MELAGAALGLSSLEGPATARARAPYDGKDGPPATAKDLFVTPAQIGSFHQDHFQLSDNFYRQQLGVPVQLGRNLPGVEPTAGRAAVVNKAFAEGGPSRDMNAPWGPGLAQELSPADKVFVERFFEPTTHANDAEYAIANSYMPAPAVQFYGKENEEDYPIWGMNGIARRYLSPYPDAAAYEWKTDGLPTVQDTSSELENDRKAGGVGRRGQLGAKWRSTDAQTGAAHANARRLPAMAEGELLDDPKGARNNDEPMDLHNLPGGMRADELSRSYHDIGAAVHETPYAWKDSELVHSSLNDIRKGSAIRSNALKDPPLPFTPFNNPGHSTALGNV